MSLLSKLGEVPPFESITKTSLTASIVVAETETVTMAVSQLFGFAISHI